MPTRQPARHSSAVRPVGARERIDRTAYQLFSRHGIQAVGIDTVVARARVAKMTLYRHYPSKNDLVLAFLRRREELWTRAWLQREVKRRARTPGARLLAIFEVFEKWFRRSDFEGCSFAKVLLEHGERSHPLRKAAQSHIETIRAFVSELAADAGVRDADGFARQWQMVMMGSIVFAYAGDRDAARRGKELGLLLLAREGIGLRRSVRA